MKGNQICILTLIVLLLTSPFVTIDGTEVEWFAATTEERSHHWLPADSNLKKLNTEERYAGSQFVGGTAIRGGDIEIGLLSAPPTNFDFFNGSRLDMIASIEGDMGINTPPYNSDFHLLLLPLKIDNISFFERLFAEKLLLENLTHSVFFNSTITTTSAIAHLKYNDILNVKYEWDLSSGKLSRKEVNAPSGNGLVVVPFLFQEASSTQLCLKFNRRIHSWNLTNLNKGKNN